MYRSHAERKVYLEVPSTSRVPWSAWGRRGASRATLGPDESGPRTNLDHHRRHRHRPHRRYFLRSHRNQQRRFQRRRRCQGQRHCRQRRQKCCSRHCQLCHRRGPGCSANQPAAVHGPPPRRHRPVATAIPPLFLSKAAWKINIRRSNYYCTLFGLVSLGSPSYRGSKLKRELLRRCIHLTIFTIVDIDWYLIW